ncbi:MAG TPA: acyloxyacyl hydrolase [Terriglobales bacterium]|nr:acyloxyacyl hydrolase [Terriglobales bacterium]
MKFLFRRFQTLAHQLRSSAAVLLPLCALVAAAQIGPEQGGTEIQVWTAGGHSVPGGRSDTGIWDAGLRYGWVLLDSHGPGILKGRFEYAIDAVPAYLIVQPANTAYGVGLNPLNLKWNFERHGRFVPYAELSGGLLFTTHEVPPGTSSVNFTPSAAFGTHILTQRFAWTLEARYLHISDAGLSRLNPGINTFELHLGLGRFTRPK